MDALVEAARAVAARAHAGQVDKAGQPYIDHPARVATRVAGDPLDEATAWLHDVLEDSDIDAATLRADGFPEEVVDAVIALTRTRGEEPDHYYRRVRANPRARRVKLADLADNSDPVRMAALPPEVSARLERKYRHARDELVSTPAAGE